MDEELQKRNTDCVYFLASPLTCKKGVECEYRHSEIARLNPRDCWYWFTGSCLNPTCAFRHPPIENRAKASSESALPPQHKSAVPVVTKTNVSCYFYFNGYCNKGERCLFLHGPDDGAWKSSKIAPSGVPDGPKTEKKTSAGSETGPAPMEKHPNSSEARPEAEANHYSLTNKVGEQSASPETSEEAIAEGFTEGGESHLSSDRTEEEEEEEEEMEDNVERDDWLESSPGFDVLVDDERLQGLSREDDHEYLLHNDIVEDYGFKDSLEYDPPAYQDIRIMSDEELDDSYYHVVKQDINEYVGEIQSVARKRKFPQERGNVDLRDLLTKRRAIENSHPIHLSSTRFELSRLNYHKDRHGSQGSQWVPRKLASKVESLDNHRGRFRESQESINKQHSKDRRMRMASRKRSSEVPKIFSGPKTLHQIREEKGKGRQDGKLSRGSEREDFLGPKPLSEILKRKKRLGSAVNLRESENLGV